MCLSPGNFGEEGFPTVCYSQTWKGKRSGFLGAFRATEPLPVFAVTRVEGDDAIVAGL